MTFVLADTQSRPRLRPLRTPGLAGTAGHGGGLVSVQTRDKVARRPGDMPAAFCRLVRAAPAGKSGVGLCASAGLRSDTRRAALSELRATGWRRAPGERASSGMVSMQVRDNTVKLGEGPFAGRSGPVPSLLPIHPGPFPSLLPIHPAPFPSLLPVYSEPFLFNIPSINAYLISVFPLFS